MLELLNQLDGFEATNKIKARAAALSGCDVLLHAEFCMLLGD